MKFSGFFISSKKVHTESVKFTPKVLNQEFFIRSFTLKAFPIFLNPKHVIATHVQVNKEEKNEIKIQRNLDNENKNVKVEEEIIHPILKNLVDKKIPIIILRNEKRFDVDVLKYLEKNHYKEIDYKYYYPIITQVEYEKSLMEENQTITLVEYERSLMEENENFKNQLEEDQINNIRS